MHRFGDMVTKMLKITEFAYTSDLTLVLSLYHTEPTVYTVRPVWSVHTVTPKSTPDTVSYGQRVRSPRSARTVSTVSCYGHPERYK